MSSATVRGVSLARQLSVPGADYQAMAARMARTPKGIAALTDGLGSETVRVRYGSAKLLRRLSKDAPELLYPHFDLLSGLLDSRHTFLRWEASRILGNLAVADSENKLERILDRYFAPVLGPEMIAAANAIASAANIALAKPHLADRIAEAILDVRGARYRTPECRNVAIGHAIRSFDRFFSHVRRRRIVLEFVREQLYNPRPATRRKAERFLKRWAGPAQWG